MRHRFGLVLMSALAAALGAPAYADRGADESKHEAQEPREAGAHVHGEARIAAAQEGGALIIELTSAMWNLVGFERAPETDEERAALEAAQAALADGAALFAPNEAARCTLAEADPGLGFDDHAPARHEDEAGHADDGHAEARHAKEGDGRDDADDAEEAVAHDHSDLRATYRFACAQPGALRRIAVGLFKAFPRLAAVEASYLGERGPAAAKLTPERAIFELR